MNEKARTIVFNISALLLLAGIAVSYLTMPTKDMDFRRRRLHRYNIFAGLLCIFASALMFSGRKEWVICLTISALLQLYTAFVAPKKEN